MSDTKPRTLRLDVTEWQKITLHNLERLHEYLSKNNMIGPLTLGEVDMHWERVRSIMGGWESESRIVAQANAQAQAEQVADDLPPYVPPQQASSPLPDVGPYPNGPEPKVRNKGGRPKGSKNLPKAAEAATQ